MMVTQANKSDEDAMNQDVFFHCMIIMNDIASRFWDNTIATQDGNGNGALIVDVASQNGAGRINATSNYRVGHFARAEGDMRKFYDSSINATASTINATSAVINATAKNAVEDYNAKYLDMTGDTNINARFDVSVTYMPDNCNLTAANTETCTWNLNGGGVLSPSTNLKRAVVTATRSSPAMQVSYTSFFSNIGSVDTRSK